MNLLEEAAAVVKDRQEKYGPPGQHWGLTVRLINTYFGTIFKPEDWAICMILDKLARERHMPQHDNLVDVAGYANGRAVILNGLADRFDEMHCKCGKVYRYVWDDESPTGKTVEEVPNGEDCRQDQS